MHTRASNSKLVEPLPEPERTLNRRLHRQNRGVPYDQRNNPPQHPRIVYPKIPNINYFRHFLDIHQNHDPIDDEPMWAADRVVASTPGSAITIPETANEFSIKEIRAFSQHENESLNDAWLRMKEMLRNCHGHNLSKGNIIKIFYHGLNEITQEVLNASASGIFLYKTPNQAYQLLEDKVLLKLDWVKNQKTKSSLKKTVAFADEELQSRAKQPIPDLDDDNIPMSREEEAKFMQTFSYQPPQSRNEHVNAIFTRNGKSYDPPDNPNDQQNNSENPINFDSDDEDDEPTPQPKTQLPKPVKETLLPKPY
ncbi:reverse transcriptase domain-containing protein [Tanacetum coccineum]